VKLNMARTIVKAHDSIESALRRFKRAVEKSGVLSKVRRCQAYEKPSAIRKRKKAAAVKRHLKKISRHNMLMRNPQLRFNQGSSSRDSKSKFSKDRATENDK
jgi:small subunit ribosomal protein S21